MKHTFFLGIFANFAIVRIFAMFFIVLDLYNGKGCLVRCSFFMSIQVSFFYS